MINQEQELNETTKTYKGFTIISSRHRTLKPVTLYQVPLFSNDDLLGKESAYFISSKAAKSFIDMVNSKQT